MGCGKNSKIKIVIDNLYDEEEGLRMEEDIILDKLDETITNENCSLNEPPADAISDAPTNRFDSISEKSNTKRGRGLFFNWGSILTALDDGKLALPLRKNQRLELSDNQIAYL